ncbi:MAG: hypothetical protein Q9227_008954 [Pyrenula ochraceoflavens]
MATPTATDKSTPAHYGPSQTALLLLDFHKMLVEKAVGPKAPAAVEAAVKMRNWAKSQGIQVIHCLVDINSTPFPTCKDYDRFAEVVAAMKSTGTGDEPAVLVNDAGNDVTFTRRPGHVSALHSPGLQDFLQKKGITSLVLTGLSTSGCVMRTALAASDAEYVTSVISDGCADPHDDVHEFAVEKVFNQRGYVSTAAEFQKDFGKGAAKGN